METSRVVARVVATSRETETSRVVAGVVAEEEEQTHHKRKRGIR